MGNSPIPFERRGSYGQVCGISLALDVVGSRWAIHILRDLAHAPLRFSDLMAMNPGLSPTVLTTRLRALRDAGVIEQRGTRRPGQTAVYSLDESARPAISGLLASLAELGSTLLDTTPLDVIPAPAFASQLDLLSRVVLARDSTLEGTFLLDFGYWQNSVVIDGDTMSSPAAPPSGTPTATASFNPPTTLMRLMGQALTPAEAEASGHLTIAGDRSKMLELLSLLSIEPVNDHN